MTNQIDENKPVTGDKSREQSNTRRSEGDTQRSEGDTQRSEGGARRSEGDTRRSEGDTRRSEVVVPAKAGTQSSLLSTSLSILAILIAAGAFGVAYMQMTKQDTSLAKQVTNLQQNVGDTATQLQSLTQSVQQLQQIQQANLRDNQDVSSLYNQLTMLNDQIDQLPLSLTPLQQVPATVPAPVVDESTMSWWEKGWSRTWQALQQIVIVRYNESKTMPLVLPEERHYLYQNLHTEMQNAIWAVLHHNQTVYQTSLAHVATWVQQYFMLQSPATINMLQALTALRAVNVQPQNQQQTGA